MFPLDSIKINRGSLEPKQVFGNPVKWQIVKYPIALPRRIY